MLVLSTLLVFVLSHTHAHMPFILAYSPLIHTCSSGFRCLGRSLFHSLSLGRTVLKYLCATIWPVACDFFIWQSCLTLCEIQPNPVAMSIVHSRSSRRSFCPARRISTSFQKTLSPSSTPCWSTSRIWILFATARTCFQHSAPPTMDPPWVSIQSSETSMTEWWLASQTLPPSLETTVTGTTSKDGQKCPSGGKKKKKKSHDHDNLICVFMT